MHHKKNKFLYLLIAGLVFLLLMAYQFKDKKIVPEKEGGATMEARGGIDSYVIIDGEEGVRKVNIFSGEIEDANALQRTDFAEFEGLPLEDESIQQTNVLVSQDKSHAIVTMTVYDMISNPDTQTIISITDYDCDVQQKKCKVSELLSQNYQGLDPQLQKNNTLLYWSKWDNRKNLLFGYLTTLEFENISPVYICDTENKICHKTEEFESADQKSVKAVVPNGTFSPSLEKFVIIAQHDDPNLQTGKSWELLLFSKNDLKKSSKTFDISVIIDADENVYDSVYSVAWSSDEKKLAIGTARKIFMLDVETGSLSLAYAAPSDEDGDFYWDNSKLYISPDGAFLAFVDMLSDEFENEDDLNDELETSTVNVLKKIDLNKNNKVTELLQGEDLSLSL